MKYVYYLRSPEKTEQEQKQGIKSYLSNRGLLIGDCTNLPPEYDFADPDYTIGVRDLLSKLKKGDVLYVWDYLVLGKTLEEIHTSLLLGTKEGGTVIQCFDGTVANNEDSDGLAIINAIGIASRLELKLSRIAKTIKFSKPAPTSHEPSKKTVRSDDTYDPSKIIVRRYSERALLITGDSREYKDRIKEIGGLFNPKIDNGRPGWIVSVRKLSQLQKILVGANYTITPDCYLSKDDYNKINGEQ